MKLRKNTRKRLHREVAAYLAFMDIARVQFTRKGKVKT